MKKLSNAALKLEGQKMFQILAQAKDLEKQGKKIYHFEIGDPDFDTPKNVIEKCIESLISSTSKFIVKPDKSFEYSLAGFQGSFFLNFITILNSNNRLNTL